MFKQLRALLFQDWIPKLTCLLIAVGLWFWIATQQSGQSTYEVPVDYVNIPENLILTDQSTRNILVTLQGPKTTLIRTSASDIVAQLDLSRQSAGSKPFWSSELDIRRPRDLQVYNIEPQKVRVDLVSRSEKVLDVQPNFTAPPVDKYKYNYEIKPDTAVIVGPDKTLDTIQSLGVQSVDLSQRDSGQYSFDLSANLPDGVRLKWPKEKSFNFQATITEKKIEKVVEDVPVSVTNVPSGMKTVVEPNSVNVRVRGPKSVVESLEADNINVNVEAPAKDAGRVIRVAEIELPENVQLVNGEDNIPALKVTLEPI